MQPPAKVSLGFLPTALIAGVFWADAMILAVVYAYGLESTIVGAGSGSFFAPWQVRALQYLLLFPLLLLAYRWSLRIGWRPWWTKVPWQILMGAVFALLGRPALILAVWMFDMKNPPLAEEHVGPWMSWLWRFVEEFSTLGIAITADFFVRYSFGLALVTGAAVYKQYKDAQLRAEALERQWSGARLAALRMQLSPHTLFNSLNLIKGQIAWNPTAAQKLLVQLADLLRRLLNAGNREFAPLREELELVGLYLELQQQRFPERLKIELPKRASMPDVWVPSLILQPLVENAVTHGLAGHEGPNRVEVRVAEQGDDLVLSVRNDVGPGATPAAERIGLGNVRERLAVHFGDRGRIVAGLVDAAQWSVEIRMPAIREPPPAVPETNPGTSPT
jgi:signal transduction histidine kinase